MFLGSSLLFPKKLQTISKDFFQTFPNFLKKMALEKCLEKHGSDPGAVTGGCQLDRAWTAGPAARRRLARRRLARCRRVAGWPSGAYNLS
jgi:hypothetical protein